MAVLGTKIPLIPKVSAIQYKFREKQVWQNTFKNIIRFYQRFQIYRIRLTNVPIILKYIILDTLIFSVLS